VSTALYSTIWLSMILFVAGEAGKRYLRAENTSLWPWSAWAVGVVLCAVHMGIAMAVRYGWSHQDAVRATAEQAAAVYGVSWSGGLYVNYVFLPIWAGETAWWRIAPRTYRSRGARLVWLLRAFYFTIIVNAVVVFARPVMRPLGMVLIAALAVTWIRISARRPLPPAATIGTPPFR
jgi:hypothetical protein